MVEIDDAVVRLLKRRAEATKNVALDVIKNAVTPEQWYQATIEAFGAGYDLAAYEYTYVLRHGELPESVLRDEEEPGDV